MPSISAIAASDDVVDVGVDGVGDRDNGVGDEDNGVGDGDKLGNPDEFAN